MTDHTLALLIAMSYVVQVGVGVGLGVGKASEKEKTYATFPIGVITAVFTIWLVCKILF